jgi:hypothetical protein
MPYTDAEKDDLERLLDHLGIEDVMCALSQICYEKEAHVQESWQDGRLASRWKRLGNSLEKMSRSLINPHFM